MIAKIESGKIDPAYSKVMQIMDALEKRKSKGSKSAADVMSRSIVSIKPGDSVGRAIRIMRDKGISQLPILDEGRCIGSISESMVIELVSEGTTDFKSTKVRDCMAESFPIMPENSMVDALADLLCYYSAVLIERKGRMVGIVTKADLLKTV